MGVVKALEKNGFTTGENLFVETFPMDTKIRNNTPEKIRKQAEEAVKRIDESSPDLLVVLDDNAFKNVALHYLGTDLPVVFSGMNVIPEEYNDIKLWMDSRIRPGHNITGVYEKLHVVDALKVEKQFIRNLNKVVMISDNSPTGRAISKQVYFELREEDPGLNFDIRPAESWEDYRKIIADVCSDPEVGAIYPAVALLKDAGGNYHGSESILRWTVKNCMKPGIPINYSWARLGLLGGCGVDFIAMGEQAGEIAARILKGENPAEIPIEDARRYALVFNLKRAEELGITIPNDVLMAADEVYY